MSKILEIHTTCDGTLIEFAGKPVSTDDDRGFRKIITLYNSQGTLITFELEQESSEGSIKLYLDESTEIHVEVKK